MKGGCFGTKCLSIASITHHGEIAKFYIICKREKNTLFGAFIDIFLDPVTFDIISFLVLTRLKSKDTFGPFDYLFEKPEAAG